jgi:hypothetical protein
LRRPDLVEYPVRMNGSLWSANASRLSIQPIRYKHRATPGFGINPLFYLLSSIIGFV